MAVAAKMFLVFFSLDSDPMFGELATPTGPGHIKFRPPIAMPRDTGVEVAPRLLLKPYHANRAVRRRFPSIAIETVSPERGLDWHAADGAIRIVQAFVGEVVLPTPNALVRAVEAAHATVVESPIWHRYSSIVRRLASVNATTDRLRHDREVARTAPAQ
jgi:hypothetical protein